MLTDLFFCRGNEARVRSAEEFRQALDDELGQFCSVEITEDKQQLVVDELDLILSLVFDEDGELIGAVTGLPDNIETEHVITLCKAFSTLGWGF